MQFNEKPGVALAACLLWATAAACLCGCQAPAGETNEQPHQEPQPEPAPELGIPDQGRIRELLEAAQRAMAEDHLIYPAKDSALALFDAVRAIDPGNAEAARGLERIVERYVDMAERAAERGALARARSMLDRARVVDAEHPAIGPSERRLNLLESAERKRLRIDAAQLRAKSPGLVSALKAFGQRARAEHCRATIRAANDADGRWIYQSMSGGPDARRIRARVQIGVPPQVEILCFSG